ncbi:MAG TPA: FAD/NAD(P)-binding oxidoreductase [Acidimicrobiales bacterium]|nr:FAD/NAD(P)-binding oxidoreductase [Acidimicrobiales bacterium]
MTRAVVVGGSLAGLRAAEALRRGGHDGPLTVVAAEPHLPYDRPPLSKQVLTGKVQPEKTAFPEAGDLEADWLLGTRATGLDVDNRVVHTDGGEDLPYDQLVIATGARPRMLRGFDPRPGVHYLRTLDDAVRLRDELSGASRVAVIGAGFIGLEVAASASERGLQVAVLEALSVPLDRAIGESMGNVIADLHRRRGIDLRTDVLVQETVGEPRVEAVRLVSGETIDADVVVVGVGVVPETRWLEDSKVDLNDGVLCDERLRVLSGGRPLKGVVAAGDVARWSHEAWSRLARVEHWTNAAEQGEAAARTLLDGDKAPAFSPVPYFWSDQFGLKIQFVGETVPGDEVSLVEGSFEEERFLVAYGREGRLVAALGIRRPARVMAMQRMIGEKAAYPPEPAA